jgi:hypothetical protein
MEEWSLSVCANRVLRKIFGSKRKEEVGDWRELQNVELRDLCYSQSIVWAFISVKVRLVGCPTCVQGERRDM